MIRARMAIWLTLGLAAITFAQVKDFQPVTREMLLNPDPGDWLMYSRTYDAQRFSPLDQINRQNVGQLRMAWVRGMGPGTQETIPLVYRGVIYVVASRRGRAGARWHQRRLDLGIPTEDRRRRGSAGGESEEPGDL